MELSSPTFAASSLHPWWTIFAPRPRATVRLLCFPYAGGSATVFRAWHRMLPGHVEVIGAQLPGRTNRIREAPFTAMPPLIEALEPSLAPLLDRPIAIFGHSLGALVGFELARRLRRGGHRAPSLLCVSGRRAAQRPRTAPPLYVEDDETFIAGLERLQGRPVDAFADPELRQLFLPTLRADFQLAETYDYRPEPPLSCPILAIGGADDEEACDGRLEAWRAQTTAAVSTHVLAGDHFFIHTSEQALLRLLAEALA